MTEALAPSDRHSFVHQGRTIYQWDQTLGEVNIYVELPPGLKARDLAIEIGSRHLKIGIKGNDPYINVRCNSPFLKVLYAKCNAGKRRIFLVLSLLFKRPTADPL